MDFVVLFIISVIVKRKTSAEVSKVFSNISRVTFSKSALVS